MAKHKKRPAIVTCLALVVFFLAVANLGSIYFGLAHRSLFASLRLSLPYWVPILLNGAWGILWIVVAWGLWRLLPWARQALMLVFPSYTLGRIGLQLMFAQGDYERGRLPFLSGVALALSMLLIFGMTRPRIQQAFEGMDAEDPIPTDNDRLD